jgi:3D-(3,5/4)-trihydroxycyclohexane-1,2-dione acylhydrolase (decyclizing)
MAERIDDPQIPTPLTRERAERAAAIARAGSLQAAIDSHLFPNTADLSVSEALILGLLAQEVATFYAVFGHGSTEIAEVLRIYQAAGLVQVFNLRSEVECSHAAVALRWIYGKKAAVVTSIGPGALQALAAALVPASDGIGVWYLLGDETSEDEGYNMQQIPHPTQGQFLRLFGTLSSAYSLHTPLAIPAALAHGRACVDHPTRPGPFFLLMPMNVQPAMMRGFNLAELPRGDAPRPGAADGDYDALARELLAAERVVVKIGGGARAAGAELTEMLERAGGVAVHTPIAAGIIPYSNPRNMTVGGSKGSICGNYAMEHADLLVAVGTRAVCQSDCSRTGYPQVRQVINVNACLEDSLHYNRTTALLGDAAASLRLLNAALARQAGASAGKAAWLEACARSRGDWEAFKAERYAAPALFDPTFGGPVLTQPGAVRTASVWAAERGARLIFDAGDVQANGFQIVEAERVGQVYTECGASYMGFAVSALLASAAVQEPGLTLALTGDGSFFMSPQVLLDGICHAARGCILLLDNRRMAAISGLQIAQYQAEFATADGVAVDYLRMASAIPGLLALDGGNSPASLREALDRAASHAGLSLVYLPVYYGPDPLGGMGVFGRWNVGSWVTETQALRHRIGL